MKNKIFLVCLVLSAFGCKEKEIVFSEKFSPIVNGTPSKETFLPAVGALVTDYPSYYQAFCTGTLVSDRLVVTAAHCLEGIPSYMPLAFFTGSDTNSSSAGTKIHPISVGHRHPKYKGGNLPGDLADVYDIAVVELKEPSSITPMKMIRPVEVNDLVEKGLSVLILGYGETKPNSDTSAGAKYQGVTDILDVGSSEIWIMSQKGAQKCHGDSGGPTLADNGIGTNEDYRLIGVASRGADTCDYGSIETRVDAYLDWIHGFGEIPCGSGLSADCNAEPPKPKKNLDELCGVNEECNGALCVQSEKGFVCSQACSLQQDDCPDGFGCIPLSGSKDGACVKRADPPPTDNTPPPASTPEENKAGLGASCESNDDCEGGICGTSAGLRFCTMFCTPEQGCGDDGSMACLPAGGEKFACAPTSSREPTSNGEEKNGGGCSMTATNPTSTSGLLLIALCLALSRKVRYSRTDRKPRPR